MSLDLHLIEDDDCVYDVNLTYNYSEMWAIAIGKAGQNYDPPKTFVLPAPKEYVKLVEIEGMTGKESMDVLYPAIAAMDDKIGVCRALNPANGWGNADLLLERLRECLKAAAENPNAVWSAYR